MKIVAARRAAGILFDLARDRRDARPWLLPANACPVLAWTLAAAGRSMRFVDLSPDDYALDRARTHEIVATRQLSAVVFVRPFGRMSDEDAFFEGLRAADPTCLIVDDRCLCEPVLERVSPAASVTLVSTGYGKPLDLGGGGLAALHPDVVFDPSLSTAFSQDDLAEQERRWRVSAATGTPVTPPGTTWLDRRPDGPAVDRLRRDIDARLAPARRHRARLTAIYESQIPTEVQLPPDFHTWRFQLLAHDSAGLVEKIVRAGLFASRHYPAIARLLGNHDAFPVADALAQRIVNLFNDAHYDEDQATRTAAIVRAHVTRA